MKMAITADLHANDSCYGIRDKDSGLLVKTADALKALDFFIEKGLEAQADRFVVVGDIYDDHCPDSLVRRLVGERLQRLAIKEDKQVVLVAGNHDSCSLHHALMPLQGWTRNLKIVDQQVVEKGEGYTAAYVPHTQDVERRKTTFAQLLASLSLKGLQSPIILFAHLAIRGAVMGDSTVSTSVLAPTVSDLEQTGAEWAFLGDFHKHQQLPSSSMKAWYVGSLERYGMDQLEGSRGFFVFDTKTLKLDRIEYPGFRPMARWEATTVEEVMAKAESQDWDGHIVRIDFKGDDRQLVEMKASMARVKSALTRRHGVHIFVEDARPKEEQAARAASSLRDGAIDLLSILRPHVERELVMEPDEVPLHMAILEDVHKKVKEEDSKWN